MADTTYIKIKVSSNDSGSGDLLVDTVEGKLETTLNKKFYRTSKVRKAVNFYKLSVSSDTATSASIISASINEIRVTAKAVPKFLTKP